MVTVSTAAATAAAAAAAELPLKGLLALNSRHLAPRTVIIFDMGIFGFFLAMSGLHRGGRTCRQVGIIWASSLLCQMWICVLTGNLLRVARSPGRKWTLKAL